jgi:hypothetical protein
MRSLLQLVDENICIILAILRIRSGSSLGAGTLLAISYASPIPIPIDTGVRIRRDVRGLRNLRRLREMLGRLRRSWVALSALPTLNNLYALDGECVLHGMALGIGETCALLGESERHLESSRAGDVVIFCCVLLWTALAAVAANEWRLRWWSRCFAGSQ